MSAFAREAGGIDIGAIGLVGIGLDVGIVGIVVVVGIDVVVDPPPPPHVGTAFATSRVMLLLLPLAHAGSAELMVDAAQATSWLRSPWSAHEENYHPNYAFDANLDTAWVEGVDGDGVGEAIEWGITGVAAARVLTVEVRAGYQKSASLWRRNGAPKDVRLVALDPRGVEVAHADATLARVLAPQPIVLTPPPGVTVNALRLELRSVWPGTRYADTAITELRTFVDTDEPYAGDVQAHKRATLLAWAASRAETAAWFAHAPADWPWGTPDWTATAPEAVDPADVTRRITALRALDPGDTGGTWRLVRTHTWPIPEGFAPGTWRLPDDYAWRGLDPVYASPRTADFVLDEATGPVAQDATFPGSYEPARLRLSATAVAWNAGEPRTPRTTAWTLEYDSDHREAGRQSIRWIASWTPDGRLDAVLRTRKVSNEAECTLEEEQVGELTWSGSHLTGVEQWTHSVTRTRGGGPSRCEGETWTKRSWTPAP